MTATTSKPKLPDFEGNEVRRAAVRFTNVGDGLKEALKIDPVALHYGDEVYYVVRGAVDQVNHKTDRDEELVRVHTIKASQISPIDAESAQEFLQAYAEETERKKAQLEGQLMLDAEKAAEERERADLAATGSARSTQSTE